MNPVEVLFADTLCARALRHLARLTSEGRAVEQTALVAHFRALGGKAAFTFAFARFCEDGLYWRAGYKWIRRAPHPDRAGRMTTSRWSGREVPVRGRNVVSWVGPAPCDAVTALTDATLQRAYETLERLALSSTDEDTETWWLDIVRAEISLRAGRIRCAA